MKHSTLLNLQLIVALVLLSTTSHLAQRVFYPATQDCAQPTLLVVDDNTVAWSKNPILPNTDFPTPSLCFGVGVPHNLGWYRFITKDNGLIKFSLNFDPASCELGQGIQGGILSDCAGTEVPDCNASCNTSTFDLNFVAEAGEDYFLWIDGCNGDVCEYEFTIEGNTLCKEPNINPLLLSYYDDENLNCIQDSGEDPVFYCTTKFQEAGQNEVFSTSALGQGFVQLPDGDYEVTSRHNFINYNFCPDSFNLTLDSSAGTNLSFGVDLNINCPLVVYNIIPPHGFDRFRCDPINKKTMLIEYQNVGNLPSSPDSAIITVDTFMTDIEILNGFRKLSDTTYKVAIDGIMVGEKKVITIEYILNCTFKDLGEIVCVRIESESLPCPEAHSPTSELYCDDIRLSYDPNDITVLPPGTTENKYIDKNETLDYLIRYQNTGNDTAYNIIIDLSTGTYDPRSVLMGAASHKTVAKYDILPNNKIRFYLNNINLVDSLTNEPESHGYLRLKLNLFAPNILDYIEHQAFIYFDFNPPIATNTDFHIISPPFLRSQREIHLCEGDIYNNQIITEDTLWKDTIVQRGPDSIITTLLTVHEHYKFEIDTLVQPGDSVLGVPIDTDTFIQRNYFTQWDCDSIIIYNVSLDSLSSNDNHATSNFIIYPNPIINNNITILGHQGGKDRFLIIYDTHGRIIFESIIKEGSNNYTLPSRIPPGVLYYNISSEHSGQITSGKLLMIK